MTAQTEAVDLLAFDNSYARLPDRFFARLPPTPVTAPRLVRLNEKLAWHLRLDPGKLATPEGVEILAGNRFKPSGPVVRWPRLYWGQFSDLWRPNNFPPKLADPRCCLCLRSIQRVLRLLTNRLSGHSLRRREHGKLQKLDLTEIPGGCRLRAGGSPVAVRRLRPEQRLKRCISVPARC